MRQAPFAALLIGSVMFGLTSAPVVAQKPQSSAQAEWRASPEWRELLTQHGGEWTIQWSPSTSTPKAIWGSGIPLADWRENSLIEARRHAHQLLHENAELLRLGTSEFREEIGARMHRVWSFKFKQYYQGLEVIGGRADVRVHMKGRVPMFGSTAFQIPENFDVTPTLTAETAWITAWQALEEKPSLAPQPRDAAPPRLVIWGDVQASTPQIPALAYEVSISNVDREGQGSIGRYYVDARTGKVLHFISDKHECGFEGCRFNRPHAPLAPLATLLPTPVPTTVTVMGWTRTGDDAYDPLVNVPMPGLEISVPGIGTVVTDQNGQFSIDIATSTTISLSGLDGRHHALISGASAPSGSWVVNPGVATTIQLLSSNSSTNEGAHTTASWWTDLTNEWTRAILGNTSQLDTASGMSVIVNRTQTCNAYYTSNSINFYQAGGGCANTAFSTVISHEWGHGLDDRYGGISQTNGLSEGWGDIIGLYIVDSPILGSGFQTSGVGIRNGNNTTQYPCSGCGVHTAGESWMGFAWKLRNRLETTYGSRATAIAISNSIVVSTIVADATNQQDAVLEVFVADDDDGNLGNGTPNYDDLVWACDQHSLPYPGQPGLTNDECVDAIALSAGVNGPFSSSGAYTSSPSWPCASGGSDVWFSYNAAGSGTLTVTTCGYASWDTAMQIFSGSCGSLTSLSCNDDSCGSYRSEVSVSVTPGTYLIRVGGYQGATGSFSLEVTAPTSPPADPSGLSATESGTDQINLSWSDNSSDEDGFEVGRSTDGVSFSVIANLAANATSFSDTGLQASTTYYYRVAAFNSSGTSGYSNIASATTESPTPPAAPTGLSATATGSDQINLSWSDNSGDEDAFEVQRSPDGTSFSLIATLGANVTSYSDTGLAGGTTYYYRVAATNAGGSSGYSNVASATTTLPQPPSSPSGLTATGVSDSAIDLAWTPGSSNETGFAIERSDSGAGNYSQIATVGAGVSAYTDTGLTAQTSYDYRVSAFNGVGSSPPSNVATGTTQSVSSTDYYVSGEIAGSGQVTGSFTLTQANDGQYQQLRERTSGGRPQNRYSYAEHTWTVTVNPAGAFELRMNAWHSTNTEGDNFAIDWSKDGNNYQSAFVVTATSDGTTYTAPLSADINGTVWIRARDTDQTSGNKLLDFLYVDELLIRATGSTGSQPPVAPNNAQATATSTSSVSVTWDDNSGTENNFELDRSLDGTNFALLALLGANQTSYTDTSVSPQTTYYYRVRATNSAGNSAWSNTAQATTPSTGSNDQAAIGELRIDGSVTGTYIDTTTANGETERITEARTGGPPSGRVTYLEHRWTFNVAAGSNISFHLRAWKSTSSDNDDFEFAWSDDGVNYQPMLTVTATSDPGSYSTFTLPSTTSGTVYVRVQDTDRTPGSNDKDTIDVDHMFIRTQ